MRFKLPPAPTATKIQSGAESEEASKLMELLSLKIFILHPLNFILCGEKLPNLNCQSPTPAFSNPRFF
jgi:hypothetical protein